MNRQTSSFSRTIFFLICFVLFGIVYLNTSVQAEKRSSPKIGLVLAGGGALGFAHIGVLKVLEEERVPVHMIAGTSMGSIVGAAYASGTSVAEMTEVLSSTDWDGLFIESPPRAELPYRLKAGRDGEILGDAKLGYRDGEFVTPSGFVSGQNILPVLQRLYSQAPTPVNFDHLPIPYRAIAADIESGQPVVLKEGDLALAARASMSVPGFFSPVEWDGRLLVDGGIANNLPVDVTLGMGADVLIVVELYADLKKREDLSSALAISGQIISLLLEQNSKAQRKLLRPRDILVEPVLKGFSSTDFKEAKALMKTGEEAARKLSQRLKALALTPEEYAEYQKSRAGIFSDKTRIDFIRIENPLKSSPELIKRALKVKEGDQFDREHIERNIEQIYNMGRFSNVSYALVTEDGKNGLVVRAEEKKWFEDYLRFGLSLEDNFEGENNYSLGAEYRMNRLNSYDAHAEFKAQIGRSPRLFGEFYQPLAPFSPYFIAPELSIGRQRLPVIFNGDTVAEYLRLTGSGMFKIGREIENLGETYIGIRRGFGDVEVEIGDPELEEFSFDIGDLVGSFTIDTLDTPDFPTSGVRFKSAYRGSMEELGASSSFDQVTGVLSVPITSGRNTLLLATDAGYSLDPLPSESAFALGGAFNGSGFNEGALLASDYILGRALAYRRISESEGLFGFEMYLGASLEAIRLWSDIDTIPDEPEIFCGSLFFGLDTPVFPAYVIFGASDEDEYSVYLTLGRLSAGRR